MTCPSVRCVEFVETVTDWMEGALDDDDALVREEHLVSCPHCTDYVIQLRATCAALASTRSGSATAAPEAARAALLDAFRSATPR